MPIPPTHPWTQAGIHAALERGGGDRRALLRSIQSFLARSLVALGKGCLCLRGPLDRDDLISAVTERLIVGNWKALRQFDESRSSLYTYLWNRMSNFLRSKCRTCRSRKTSDEQHLADVCSPSPSSTPEDDLDEVERYHRVWADVEAATSKRDVEIYLQRERDNRPVEDIARQFGINPGNIYTIVNRVGAKIAAAIYVHFPDEKPRGKS